MNAPAKSSNARSAAGGWLRESRLQKIECFDYGGSFSGICDSRDAFAQKSDGILATMKNMFVGKKRHDVIQTEARTPSGKLKNVKKATNTGSADWIPWALGHENPLQNRTVRGTSKIIASPDRRTMHLNWISVSIRSGNSAQENLDSEEESGTDNMAGFLHHSCSVFCLPVHNIFQLTFSHVLPYHRTTRSFLREVSPILAIFQLLQQRFAIQTFSVFIKKSFVGFAFTLSASQIYVVKKWCWFINIHIFINFFQMGAVFCFLPSILMSSTYTIKNNPCFSMNKQTFPVRYFSHPSSSRTSSNCLSHKGPASGCPNKFSFKKNDWIFHPGPRFRPFVPWKTYPFIWILWLWISEQSWSVLQFYLSAGWYCISCLSVRVW